MNILRLLFPQFFRPHEVANTGQMRHDDLRVFLQADAVADLDWLYDDQPSHVYRLIVLDHDRSRVDHALGSAWRLEETAVPPVLIQTRATGRLLIPYVFFPSISWEEQIVRIRWYGPKLRPPRDPLPEDEIPGFGSAAEALRLVWEAMPASR